MGNVRSKLEQFEEKLAGTVRFEKLNVFRTLGEAAQALANSKEYNLSLLIMQEEKKNAY